MALFMLRRIGVMLLAALCLSFVVFFLTNLYPNLEKLAKTQGNQRMTDAQVTSWLDRRGYLQPLPVRYGQWLGVLPGYVHRAADGTLSGRCIDPRRPATAASCRATGAAPPFSRNRSAPSFCAGWP